MLKALYIALNSIRIEFSSRWTIVFFLILPLIFTAIIGGAMRNMYGEDDPEADRRFPVVVVDEDQSELAAELLDALAASDVIRPVVQSGDEVDRLLQADGFQNLGAPALLIIPTGFGRQLRAAEQAGLTLHKAAGDDRVLAVEQAVQAAAAQVSNAVAAALISVAEAERLEPFAGEAERQAYFVQGLDLARDMLADPPARVEATQAAEVRTQIATGFEQSSAGQLVTWVLITLVGAAEVFVSERLAGTLRRLVVTPTARATILGGKILGYLAMGLVQMVVLIGFGLLVFGVDWGRSPAALAVIVLAFALAAVAFGVLLGTWARTRSQAGGLTILFSMLMAALGGAWWPLEVTPPVYQAVVKFLPTTWAMIGFNDVIVRGQDVVGVLPEAGVLLAFAAAFITTGIVRFRYE